jgi:hypothetical protein
MEVLEYDKEGAILVFEHTSGRFLELEQDQVSQLSEMNRVRYRTIAEIVEEESEEDPILVQVASMIEAGSNNGNATSRLHVEGLPKGVDHYWQRPDRLGESYKEGWVLCQIDGVKTLNNQSGKGIHRIGKRGEEELVLLVRSKEETRKFKQRRIDTYRERSRGITRGGAKEVETAGFASVTDQTKVGRGEKFEPIPREEAE